MKKLLFLLLCIVGTSVYGQGTAIGALGARDTTPNPRYAAKIMPHGGQFWVENYLDEPITVRYTVNTDAFVPGKMGGLIDVPAHKAFLCPGFNAADGHIAFMLEGYDYPDSYIKFDLATRLFVRPNQ